MVFPSLVEQLLPIYSNMIVIFCFGIIVIYNYRENFETVKKREKIMREKRVVFCKQNACKTWMVY